LRDLDGLVLVGWHLASLGVEVWLVPMYEQSFDVRAIDADLVLVNYVRANNFNHVMAYRSEGIRVAVMDTEGVGGKTPEEFSSLVAATGGAAAVDLYCVWGVAQQRALIDAGVVPEDRVRVTGCPRYDYCVPPWRDILPQTAAAPGYILVNTNFPTINPRFSAGTVDEIANAVKAGFSKQFAESYACDARIAHSGMLTLVETLLKRWPSQQFVLRPHPFESDECYRDLKRYSNFSLYQEGTSLEWLNNAIALLHLNCSTAVEAAMLGKPALSPAWLDTPTLHLPGPASVSYLAASPTALIAALDAVLSSSPLVEARHLRGAMQALRATYHNMDGRAGERVAHAIVSAMSEPPNPNVGASPNVRSRVVFCLRNLLGHTIAARLESFCRPVGESKRSAAKLFTVKQVDLIVKRLQGCNPNRPRLRVEAMDGVSLHRPHLASRRSIRILIEG
jgi:surface carbohydrate biosynthesis protein